MTDRPILFSAPMVRALLAKQYMNGVRLVINARKSLEDGARPAAIGSGQGREA